jgi:hypothetical protein
MKHAILPLTLVAFLAATADAPTFVPKNRTVVKRTLEMKGTRDLSSEAIEVAGEHQTNPNPFRKVELSWKYAVTDNYDRCVNDKIERLKRTYDSLAKSRTEKAKDQKGAEVSKEVRETCDLEGKTVTFAWDDKKEIYTPSFEDDGDKALLADLDLDMDYREFLPDPKAETGAKWEKDFADVKLNLLRPGGDLPFHSEVPARPMDMRMRAAVWDATKGKIEFELKPATGEGANRVAHIHFHGVNGADASTDAEANEEGPSKLELHDEQTFEGELVWDMDACRARSIEWSSKGTMVLKVSSPVKSKSGEEATLVRAFTFDTDYDYTGSFEVQ